MKVLISVFILLLLGSCASNPVQLKKVVSSSEKDVLIPWVEMGPDSKAIARVITGDPTCPLIQIGAVSQAMESRTSPSQQFPVRVCESVIPWGTQTARIGDHILSLPKENPKRILVFGDTGCRIKVTSKYQIIQDCNNPDSWPFLKIAQLSAEWKPDLVIHVGDYLYRESECPSGNEGCAGSPSGYDWSTWKADFFTPANTLLQAAPWVFVRGNHELCDRAGEGWFRFLDPRPYSASCKDYSDPYWFKVGAVQMVVLDSAKADDGKAPGKEVAEYASQFKQIQAFPIKTGWFLTHRPIWGVFDNFADSKSNTPLKLNATLQAAAKGNLSQNIKLILSGHIHLFETASFKDQGPSQFVLGNGGTELTDVPKKIIGIKVGDRVIKSGLAIQNFGFMTMEVSTPGRWNATIHDKSGKIIKQCAIQGSRVQCR